jgi:hypothetical protein
MESCGLAGVTQEQDAGLMPGATTAKTNGRQTFSYCGDKDFFSRRMILGLTLGIATRYPSA